jgi:hypothetical protein
VTASDYAGVWESNRGIAAERDSELAAQEPEKALACTKELVAQALVLLGNSTDTDPTTVRRLARAMFVDDYAPAQRALGNLTRVPRSMLPLLDQIAMCSAENAMLAAVACEFVRDPTLQLQLRATAGSPAEVMRWILTAALVLEELTLMMQRDYMTAFDGMNHILERMVQNGGLALFDKLDVSQKLKGFVKDKFRAIEQYVRSVNQARMTRSAGQPSELEALLQINILEAVHNDLAANNTPNGLTGIAIAHHTRNRMRAAISLYAADNGNVELRRVIGKDW